MSSDSDLGRTAAQAFRSALVIASALSLALTFWQIAEGQQLVQRHRALVTIEAREQAPLVVPPRLEERPGGQYPLYMFPPRTHGFSGGTLTDHPDVWPVIVHKVAPEYTETAKRARIAGIVIVEAIIDAAGVVREVRVAKPLPFGLDQKAVEAVKQWTFKPGLINGKPVPVIMRLTVRFAPDLK